MTRQNFYQGQSVAPEHLNKLQTYAEQGQADLIASLLGYGIVNGFEVSTIEGHIVGVTAGLAFNLAGERLVLAEGQQVNLAQYIPNVGDKIVKLGIVSDFIKTDPVTDSMGNIEQTTWTPTVQFITGESLDSGIFELAEIKINPLSVVEIKATEAHFTTLSKQVAKAHAFSTDRLPESTIANIDADILNINKKSFADTIRDLIYPIDTTYTQHPDPTTGLFRENQTPFAKLGGVWELWKTVLFNNVPTVKVGDFGGISTKYPSGELTYKLLSSEAIWGELPEFPIPFSKIPLLIPSISNGNSSSYTTVNQSGANVGAYEITTKKFRIYTNISTHEYGRSVSIYGIGQWKDPTDPLTPEEEKWYVKIWKRIG